MRASESRSRSVVPEFENHESRGLRIFDAVLVLSVIAVAAFLAIGALL